MMAGSEEKIPILIFESTMARMERTIKRLWILCIVLVVLLFGTNLGWVIYESQFMDVIEETEIDAEQSTDSGGTNLVVGGDLNG